MRTTFIQKLLFVLLIFSSKQIYATNPCTLDNKGNNKYKDKELVQNLDAYYTREIEAKKENYRQKLLLKETDYDRLKHDELKTKRRIKLKVVYEKMQNQGIQQETLSTEEKRLFNKYEIARQKVEKKVKERYPYSNSRAYCHNRDRESWGAFHQGKIGRYRRKMLEIKARAYPQRVQFTFSSKPIYEVTPLSRTVFHNRGNKEAEQIEAERILDIYYTEQIEAEKEEYRQELLLEETDYDRLKHDELKEKEGTLSTEEQKLLNKYKIIRQNVERKVSERYPYSGSEAYNYNRDRVSHAIYCHEEAKVYRQALQKIRAEEAKVYRQELLEGVKVRIRKQLRQYLPFILGYYFFSFVAEIVSGICKKNTGNTLFYYLTQRYRYQ